MNDEEWSFDRQKHREIWLAINELRNQASSILTTAGAVPPNNLEMSRMPSKDFEQIVKSGGFVHLLKKELRAIRILQNYDVMCSDVNVLQFDSAGRKIQIQETMKIVRTGTARLKNRLSLLEGGQGPLVHSTQIRVALKEAANIDPEFYTVKNKLLNARPRNKFEIFAGSKTETLLLRRNENYEKRFPDYFDSGDIIEPC